MRVFLAALFAYFAFFGLSASAAPVSAATERVEIELLPEWEALPANGGTMRLALTQKIIPGWHTYWSNPGDSGEPTAIIWSVDSRREQWGPPEGFKGGEMIFPHPHRIPYGPLVNFGYEGEVTFLSSLEVPAGLEPGSVIDLPVRVRWLVCEEICIPEQVDVTLSFPVLAGPAQVDERALEIIETAPFPQPSPWAALFEIENNQLKLGIEAPEAFTAFQAGTLQKIEFFPHRDGIIANADPQTLSYGADGFTLTTGLGFRFTTNGVEVPEAFDGVLVLYDASGEEVAEQSVIVSATQGTIPATWSGSALGAGGSSLSAGLPWWQVLLFAVLGGLILNIMPCVFPILFMKAFGFVEAAKKSPNAVRAHGLAFTAGVLISFAVIGGVLLALRAGGEQIGWGFQLQSPVFVGSLIYLLLIVGMSLSGVFELGQSLMGVGGSAAQKSGTAGAFFTGVLATIVATPCTAPFMGAAVAFGLTQPGPLALIVFLALGFGMALPWLLLSFFPPLLSLLPRPGAWMDIAKQLLAFPIYATALWLLWVLTQQVGPGSLAAILTGALLIGVAGWAWGAQQSGSGKGAWPLVGKGLAVVMAATAMALLFGVSPGGTGQSVSASGASQGSKIPYEAYSEARLSELQSAGTPVFVNATAAWCITCLVNERGALSSNAVAKRFEEAGIVYLKADWTNRDAEITRLLERFGRSGVPLYVYFPPRGEPVILPQMLSERAILDILSDL